MNRSVLALALVATAAQLASAGHLEMGGFGERGFGGHGFGHHGGGDEIGGFGGLGFFGGWGYDPERQQARFEDKFDDLQSDYDDGLADVEDFYNSDEYSDVVDGTELLVDRYGLFVSGVERAVDRLDDYLGILNDDLTFYQDLLAEYQDRNDLSDERLERITNRLTNIQDHISGKIDLLTEKQTTLSDNLGTYQTFSDDLSAYLAEIVAAGGGTTDTEETTAAILANPVALSSIANSVTFSAATEYCEMPPTAAAATAVPEPRGALMCAVALAGALSLRRRPRDGRRR